MIMKKIGSMMKLKSLAFILLCVIVSAGVLSAQTVGQVFAVDFPGTAPGKAGAYNEAGGVYPLNAIMCGGIVYASGVGAWRYIYNGGSHDLRHEARSFFGGGYGLQELYIDPSLMNADRWDAVADAARWAAGKSHILVDTHFIGPSPAENEVYGYASWQDNAGTLTLRNPSSSTKSYSLDIGEAFELPQGAQQAYDLLSPFPDQRIQTLTAAEGSPESIELQPFEVLVFDALPAATLGALIYGK